MPRPKVKPQDRQRAVRACTTCKRSKIRCDGDLPCSTCKRRSREDGCVYDLSPSPKLRRRQPSTVTATITEATPSATDLPSPKSWQNHPDVTMDETTSVERDPDSPKSRMLLGSNLQKGESQLNTDSFSLGGTADRFVVYVGETAALSYLQFLRNIVKHSIGSCTFTENETNYMLENEAPPIGTETPSTLEPRHSEALIDYYLQATSGLLDLYNRSEILNSIVCQNTSQKGKVSTAAIFLMTAIGAQCRGTELSDIYHSSTFFQRGRILAFEGMLCDPSIDMVVNFLLMVVWMLGACQRNAAFMYLGIASKAATALGLHRREHYAELPPNERQIRLGIWKSLQVLDSVYNSILGRTSIVVSTPHDARRLKPLLEGSSPGHIQDVAVNAMYSIAPFLDELAQRGSEQSTGSLEDFLLRLQQWSKALPEELRCYPGSPQTGVVRGDDPCQYLGAMHVACIYYFTIMLATRRYLTMDLVPKVRRTPTPAPSSIDRSPAAAGLAHVCLNAAVNLAKVGLHALHSGKILNNQCILKAWMFSAGLLLGFSLFAEPPGTDPEVEEAFDGARQVLKHLAPLSPLSGHYHDILSSLAEAVTTRHRHRTEDRRRTASRFMDCLFTTNDNLVGSLGSDLALSLESQPMMAGMDAVGDAGFGSSTIGDSELMAGFALEDLSFDWQPFAPFFDDCM